MHGEPWGACGRWAFVSRASMACITGRAMKFWAVKVRGHATRRNRGVPYFSFYPPSMEGSLEEGILELCFLQPRGVHFGSQRLLQSWQDFTRTFL